MKVIVSYCNVSIFFGCLTLCIQLILYIVECIIRYLDITHLRLITHF